MAGALHTIGLNRIEAEKLCTPTNIDRYRRGSVIRTQEFAIAHS
jgi:hypothetical protein